MQLVKGKPPHLIAERCAHAFDLTDCEPAYTYGETIYNPSGNPLDEAFIAHESVHMIQQGEKPAEWWDKYIEDRHFRFSQELAAYRVQYKTMKQLVPDRNELARLLVLYAQDLSGPQYGNLCTLQDAIGLIRE